MPSMKVLVMGIIVIMMMLADGCQAEKPIGEPFKDLSEQMDVLAILQGSIGTDLQKNDWEGAGYMTRSMDSVLKICSEDFIKHQRLKEPFREFYERKMERAIGSLLRSIRRRDSVAARKSYEFLVKRCNSCHNENEVAERAHL